jgi:lia operon protein LiaG
MNRKFSVVMIAVWSAIAIVLIGMLVTFIVLGKNLNLHNWNYYFDGSNSAQTQYVDKSFKSSGVSEIAVNAASADVSFSKTQGDYIKVNIKGNGDSDSKDMYSVTQDGSTLKIVQKNNSWFGGLFHFGWFEQQIISVTLPESYKKDLTLNITSGDVSFNGDYTFGKAGIYETSGDINAGSLTADTITLKTVSGEINVSKLDANYEIHSTSGEMKFGNLAGYGGISTISGDLSCYVSKLSGAFNVSAISGDMKIGIDSNVSADISANTTSGDIHGIPMEYSGRGRSNATAQVGSSPYNKVAVSTVSGDVSFSRE